MTDGVFLLLSWVLILGVGSYFHRKQRIKLEKLIPLDPLQQAAQDYLVSHGWEKDDNYNLHKGDKKVELVDYLKKFRGSSLPVKGERFYWVFTLGKEQIASRTAPNLLREESKLLKYFIIN